MVAERHNRASTLLLSRVVPKRWRRHGQQPKLGLVGNETLHHGAHVVVCRGVVPDQDSELLCGVVEPGQRIQAAFDGSRFVARGNQNADPREVGWAQAYRSAPQHHQQCQAVQPKKNTPKKTAENGIGEQ